LGLTRDRDDTMLRAEMDRNLNLNLQGLLLLRSLADGF
jgi:hypothetical protein